MEKQPTIYASAAAAPPAQQGFIPRWAKTLAIVLIIALIAYIVLSVLLGKNCPKGEKTLLCDLIRAGQNIGNFLVGLTKYLWLFLIFAAGYLLFSLGITKTQPEKPSPDIIDDGGKNPDDNPDVNPDDNPDVDPNNGGD